ncbi:MAG: hypothetical protein BBJ60_12430 [Desulfobacterales bacterium S7086C20]|nr:tetratricopeptide repeat protein [Deltaproteobacteria bacterium]OEU45869.1 MAG: hypothetical protein BBJ60_12430 [Desulfobacterales bacterium S7086C20]
MSRSEEHLVGAQALKADFPYMLIGEDFEVLFEVFAEENDQFAALVICIDDFEKKLKDLGQTIVSTVVVKLARVVDDMSEAQLMTWGCAGQGCFACLCRNMDQIQAVELAKELQRRFTLLSNETVSVGLAVFPFWPFERGAVLANAQKALDHAAFFGANTITPFDAVSLNISADKLYQYGDIDGAVEEFKTAAMVDSQNVNVHNSLGVCYGVQAKLDLAIDAFETAIEINPKDVMATYNLGLAYLKQENRDVALELFLKAHSLDGDNPDIAGHIGMCYQEMGQVDKALGYLEGAVEKISWGTAVFRALGDCYLEKDLPRKAAKAFEKAIKAHPKDAKSLNTLGHIYGMLGENLEIAIVLAEESVSIDRNKGLYRCRLGKLYLQVGNYDKALKELRKADELGQACSELIAEAESRAAVYRGQ